MEIEKLKFKDEVVAGRFDGCLPLLRNIVRVMADWCESRGVPFLITESRTTLEEDQRLQRTSKTHREGRAVDLSVQGWKSEDINAFVSYFCALYKDVAAVTTGGINRLVLYHNSGHGDHLHVQIRRQP